MRLTVPIFCLILFSPLSVLHAQNNAQEKWKYEINIATDNDWFVYHLETDRYYSFGLDIGFKVIPNRSGRLFPRKEKPFLSFSLHQQGYTPEYLNGDVKEDRPFAGWLFLRAQEVYSFDKSLLKLGFELGVLGPSARAGEVQNWFHDLAGFSYVDGWENQIADQPGLNIILNYVAPVLEKDRWDLLVEGNASLGTVHTFLWPSALFRIGKFNDYRQSTITNTSISSVPGDKELFFSIGPGLKYVVYDATLMGGLFDEEAFLTRSEINELRLTGEFGINYLTRGWSFILTYFYFSGEMDVADSHRYGRLEIAKRF